jgi:glycerate kinase
MCSTASWLDTSRASHDRLQGRVPPVRVLVAPDSFKGSLSAGQAAAAITRGWQRLRPCDDMRLLPLADGGEGTLEVFAATNPGAVTVPVPRVVGPLGQPVDAEYLMLEDGTAVVELARSSGLPLAVPLDPLHATTRGTGQVVLAAIRAGARRIVLALGGSASTDGGAGLLCALGLRILDRHGAPVADGGLALRHAVRIDDSELVTAPPGGVTVLTDVMNPLLGPTGAAAVYAPQKGASPDQVALLEQSLARWAELCGGEAQTPGAGAAGGTAYGVRRWWGAEIRSGSDYLMEAAGLDAAIADADLVLTGEGSFDRTSFSGKLSGRVLGRAAAGGVNAAVICGRRDPRDDRVREVAAVSLAELSGSARAAQTAPQTWATRGGERAAELWGSDA